MSGQHNKYERRRIRRYRIRRRVSGSSERPRLSVFRSSRHIYAQIVDDVRGVTLAAASSREDVTVEGKGKLGLSQAGDAADLDLGTALRSVLQQGFTNKT